MLHSTELDTAPLHAQQPRDDSPDAPYYDRFDQRESPQPSPQPSPPMSPPQYQQHFEAAEQQHHYEPQRVSARDWVTSVMVYRES